jgi:hypothetical protein
MRLNTKINFVESTAMSAPSLEYKHAAYLDYAFLAAKAEKAADSLIDIHALSDDERHALKAGSEFLEQVATGARAVTHGDYRVNNLTSAMEALELAVDPLEHLGAVIKQADIADVLHDVAITVSAASDRAVALELTAADRSKVDLFKVFFDHFYRFIRVQMGLMDKEPLIGDRGRFNISSSARLAW